MADWNPNEWSKAGSIAGGAAGSLGGPIGSGVGSVLGSFLPHLLHKLSGSTNNPQQQGKSVTGYDFNQNPDIQNIRKLWESSPYNKPFDSGQVNQQFNEQVADPSTKFYNERIRPGTESRFNNPNTTGGSALKKALTQGAEDLGGSLAGLRSNYLQSQQQNHANGQYNQIAQRLGLANNQANENYFDPNGQSSGFPDIFESLFSNQDFMKALQQKFGGSNFQDNGNGVGSAIGQQGNWQVPGQLESSPQSGNDYYNNLVASWGL